MLDNNVQHRFEGGNRPPGDGGKDSRPPETNPNVLNATKGVSDSVVGAPEQGTRQLSGRPGGGSQASEKNAQGEVATAAPPPVENAAHSAAEPADSGTVTTPGHASWDGSVVRANVDVTAEKKSKKNYLPIHRIIPKNLQNKTKLDFVTSSGGYRMAMPSPYPEGEEPTEEELKARELSNRDFLLNEITDGQFSSKEAFERKKKIQNMYKNSSDEKIFWNSLNNLPSSEFSHKMYLVNEFLVPETTMEQIMRAEATKARTETVEELEPKAARCAEIMIQMAYLADNNLVGTEEDQCEDLVPIWEAAREDFVKSVAYLALSKVRVIGNVAHFPGVNSPIWFEEFYCNSPIFGRLMANTTIPAIIRKLHEIVADAQFRVQDTGAVFSLEQALDSHGSYAQLKVVYHNMLFAKEYFRSHFLLQCDRIRHWEEHKSAEDAYKFATAIVDLGLDKLPTKRATFNAYQDNLGQNLRTGTMKYTEARVRANGNANDDPVIANLIKMHEKEKGRYTLKIKLIPENAKQQSFPTECTMEVYIEFSEAHCPVCRTKEHTIGQCTKKKCYLCKHSSHLIEACPSKCDCDLSVHHLRGNCPSKQNANPAKSPQKKQKSDKYEVDADGFMKPKASKPKPKQTTVTVVKPKPAQPVHRNPISILGEESLESVHRPDPPVSTGTRKDDPPTTVEPTPSYEAPSEDEDGDDAMDQSVEMVLDSSPSAPPSPTLPEPTPSTLPSVAERESTVATVPDATQTTQDTMSTMPGLLGILGAAAPISESSQDSMSTRGSLSGLTFPTHPNTTLAKEKAEVIPIVSEEEDPFASETNPQPTSQENEDVAAPEVLDQDMDTDVDEQGEEAVSIPATPTPNASRSTRTSTRRSSTRKQATPSRRKPAPKLGPLRDDVALSPERGTIASRTRSRSPSPTRQARPSIARDPTEVLDAVRITDLIDELTTEHAAEKQRARKY